MISHLHLESFKCFSSYDVEFKQIQLLIGGNNSGKTTIFQALQVFFWCLDQTADVADAAVNLRKTQLPEVLVSTGRSSLTDRRAATSRPS